MPEIRNIYPAQIHIDVKYTLEEIKMLRDFLSKCEFKAPLSEPQYAAANEFMQSFFPFLDDTINSIEGKA